MNARSLLRRFIRDSKLSQAELARRLEVSRASVCLWRSGRTIPGPLNALTLERLSGGAVPAAAWSKEYAAGLLTAGVGQQEPTPVLNERQGALSPQSSTPRRAAGGSR